MESQEDRVRVKFVTKVPSLRVTETPIAVPRSLRRYGLSEIINHLLGSAKATPFDILVHGQFLRCSLRQYMERNALSGESVLELEYLPAMREPEERSGAEQPDWVGAIAGVGASHFVTGGYDGALRVYDYDCKAVATAEAASSLPITVAVGAVTSSAGDDSFTCLTGGKDHTARLWTFRAEDRRLELAGVLSGHQNSVSAASASPAAGGGFLTGDFDGHVCLWKVVPPASGGGTGGDGSGGAESGARSTGSGKRRKMAPAAAVGEEGTSGLPPPKQLPAASFKAHSQAVAGLVWPSRGGGSAGTLCTGSWDRSIKVWDLERQDCVHTFSAAKAVTCMAGSAAAAAGGGDGRPALLATGHPDAIVRVWDPRADSAALTLVRAALESHRQWVSGVAWCPDSEHLLASSGQDGAVKLWDVRASLPLHSAQAHAGKALCVAWHGREILSGGADGAVKRFLVPERP